MTESLAQKAYWHIHGKLTEGAFEPGLRLSNRAVAGEIGISFTPVREALNRLVSEGLLEYREGLGVFVPRTSPRDIEELYEVREILECAVVAKTSGRFSEETIRQLHLLEGQMREIADVMESTQDVGQHAEQFRQLDTALHLALIRGLGNRQLLEIMTNLRRRCVVKAGGGSGGTILVGHVFRAEPIESVRRTCREHDSLLVLLGSAGKGPEAAQLMAKHIRTGRRLALAALERVYMNSPRPTRPRRSMAAQCLSEGLCGENP